MPAAEASDLRAKEKAKNNETVTDAQATSCLMVKSA